MIKELLTALLIPMGSVLAGQTITISEELPLRNDFSYTILGWIDEDLLLFRDKGHEFYVQSFDEEMHLKWEREIYIGPRKADIIGIVSDTNRFHLIVGMREKGDYILQHRIYDGSITLTDTMTLDTMQNIFITPRYFISESEDKHKVLLFRQINGGLNLCSYGLHQKKILWKNEFEFRGGNLHLNYGSMELDNDGNFYLVLEPDKFFTKSTTARSVLFKSRHRRSNARDS